MKEKELIKRIDHIILKGDNLLQILINNNADYDITGEFTGVRALGLSLISSLYGNNHSYYREFNTQSKNNYDYNIKFSIEILRSIKYEIENGWLISFKNLISAEFFSDFMEMSGYLLEEKYKDPAAVIIGSVLEEKLRQLCNENNIEVYIQKGNKNIFKKADTMNNELYKENIYNSLQQKNITSWLDLRNKAAHGKYAEYTIEDVKLMYQGLLNFLSN